MVSFRGATGSVTVIEVPARLAAITRKSPSNVSADFFPFGSTSATTAFPRLNVMPEIRGTE